LNESDERGDANVSEILSKFTAGEFVGLVAVAGGCLVAIVAIAGGIWAKVRHTEMAAMLKHDMLARGMSAQEIQMVLDAGKDCSEKAADACHSH
jgi:hypothetical protein